MAKPQPDYRTDVLACPLNRGKLAQVVGLVLAMRRCAKWEAATQWRQFYQGGWNGFEATAKAGWTRPWVKDGTLTVSHAQMVMSQVAGSLQGYLGNVQNTFVDLVAGSSLPPRIRHQLYFINRKNAWFWSCPVALSQSIDEIHPKTGRLSQVSRKNAARTLRDRRSIASSRTGSRHRVKTTLIEQVRLFNERFTRPRGRPADPRFSNPYFKAWAGGVRSPEAATPLPSSTCALA